MSVTARGEVSSLSPVLSRAVRVSKPRRIGRCWCANRFANCRVVMYKEPNLNTAITTMTAPLLDFDFSLLDSTDFKEDSVREEIIQPILKALGYSAGGKNRIIRSLALSH